MFLKVLTFLRSNVTLILSFTACVFVAVIGYKAGRSSRNDEIASLRTRLASSENTIEIEKNLYATRTREIEDLNGVIKSLKATSAADQEAISFLVEQLEVTNQRVLTLNSLVIKWKKAYEGVANATQTEVPPDIEQPPGQLARTRVDFKKDFGVIGVSGHTITNPAEAYVKVEQLQPVRIILAVAKRKDGGWSTYATSSDDNIAVDIAISGVDLSVLERRWYQNIWVTAQGNVVGERSGVLGLSYQFDRISVGGQCGYGELGMSCGASVGYRIFK